jgi:hypothetical protein
MSMNDDLNVLFPERMLRVNNEELTFHEITLSQQLKHRTRIKPLADGFAALAQHVAKTGEAPSLDAIFDMLAANADDVAFLVALSCGKDAAWYESLHGQTGDDVLLTWWTVNTGFFCRAAMRPAQEDAAIALLNRNASAESSLTSSSTGTDSAT